jgi:hypothetical protein
MKKILMLFCFLVFTSSLFSQAWTFPGWQPYKVKQYFGDSVYVAKDIRTPSGYVQTQLNTLQDSIAALRTSIISLQAASSPSYPTYYIANAGSDGADGLTPATPWQTIAKINSAMASLVPGSKVYFNRGDQWREQLTITQNGSATNPITFTAYGTGAKPKINAADIKTGWGHKYHQYSNIWGIVCPNVTPARCMVVINGILFTQTTSVAALSSGKYFIKVGTPDSVYVCSATDPSTVTSEVSARDYGIYSTKKYLTISYLDVRMAGSKGILLEGSGVEVDGYSLIDSCNVYRNRLAGIGLYDGYSYSTIQRCTGTYNGNTFISWGNQIGGEGTGGVGSDYNTIKNCYSAYSIHDYAIAGQYSDGTAYQTFNSNGDVIQNNESGHDAEGIFLDPHTKGSTTVTCRYNYVHDCNTTTASQAIGIGTSGTGDVFNIYYNLVVNCGNSGGAYAPIMFANTIGGHVYFYNNTVYNNGVAVILTQLFAVHGTNITMKNNIFYFSTASDSYYFNWEISSTGFWTSDYNQVYKSTGGTAVYAYAQYNGGAPYTTFAAWKSASSQDAHSGYVDPLFTTTGSDFTLQTGSPCKNTGTVIATIPQVDILGNPIVGLPDMGCYEHQ